MLGDFNRQASVLAAFFRDWDGGFRASLQNPMRLTLEDYVVTAYFKDNFELLRRGAFYWQHSAIACFPARSVSGTSYKSCSSFPTEMYWT